MKTLRAIVAVSSFLGTGIPIGSKGANLFGMSWPRQQARNSPIVLPQVSSDDISSDAPITIHIFSQRRHQLWSNFFLILKISTWSRPVYHHFYAQLTISLHVVRFAEHRLPTSHLTDYGRYFGRVFSIIKIVFSPMGPNISFNMYT